jgi:hypothetical protein
MAVSHSNHRPSLIKSSFMPLGDVPAQTDDLATTLTVCLFIICVYFLYWLKQKVSDGHYCSVGRNRSKLKYNIMGIMIFNPR